MWLVIQVLLVTGVLAVALVGVSRAVRIIADRRSAEEAMFALHLRRLGLRPMIGGAFTGTWRGRPFRLISRHRVDPRLGTPSVMSVGTPVPTGLLRIGESGRKLGDDRFDPWFRVAGDTPALVLLTSEVRGALLHALERGRPRIEDGTLWLDLLVPAGPITDLRPILDPLLDLAEHVIRSAGQPVPDLLVEWATDPSPGIRRTCIDLVDRRLGGEAPPPFVRVLLDDSDPMVRIRAALALGETGPLLAVAVDPTVPVRVRLYAVGMLVRRGTDDERLAAAASLASGSDPVARSAVTLCEAVGTGAEPVVLDLLDVHKAQVVRGAVRWASHYGSLATLPRLRSIERGTARLSPLSAEVRVAIDQVRSRGSQMVGGVTLVADRPEVGALSPADR